MIIQELKNELEKLYHQTVGIMVFLLMKGDNNIKLADVDSEKALPELLSYYLSSIKARILDQEELDVISISQADDRSNVLYYYDLEIPAELSELSSVYENQEVPKFNFETDNLQDIKGYMVLIGTDEFKVILYKKQYPVSLIKRDSFLIFKSNERFSRLESDVIRLDDNFQFLYINNELYIKDVDVLEKYFGFHNIIVREANKAVQMIDESGILDDSSVLTESIEKMSFARKLTRIRSSSPVLGKISKSRVIEFTKNNPVYSGKFKYNETGDKIRLDTKVSQELFIKLLNDSILKSELTEMYYDSLAKDEISV